MALNSLKIDGARFALTLDNSRRIISDCSILVEGQRISRVCKKSELQNVGADRVIDAREMIVTPGFINAHLHLSNAHASRGLFTDSLTHDETINQVAMLNEVMSEEEEYQISLIAITEALKSGTTCILDPGTTKHPDACMEAYDNSGGRFIIGQHMLDLPNPRRIPITTPYEAGEKMQGIIAKYDHTLDDRVRAWPMLWSVDHSSKELLRTAKQVADSNNTGVTVHCINSEESVQHHIDSFGKRPIEYLDAIEVLGPNLLLSHVIGLSESEVDCIARTNTKMVMCPPAALKSGSGTTIKGMLPEMLGQGIPVALGNDSANYGPVETLRSMYLAAILYKDARQSTKMVPAESALEMATINGAKSLGLEDELGSIEEGKKADLVLFDTRRPELSTLFNPVNNIVYNADGRSVHSVIVNGKLVVENYQALFVDESTLIDEVQTISENLIERAGFNISSKWPLV